MTVLPLGDSAAVIVLGNQIDPAVAVRVRAVAAEIERHRPAWATDVVPAFASVAVFFNPASAPAFEALRAELESMAAGAGAPAGAVEARTVEVPVIYGGEAGPDLADVAAHTRLSPADVIARHTQADYLVHAIGFSPGFPYLGGLPAELAVPRRATPRPRVPAGSVGIGGAQTGIYPLESPGGWNLIGRTPFALFDPARREPALLRVGDRVKFVSVTAGGAVEFQHAPLAPANRSEATRPSANVTVVRAGILTTVQDLGRAGHRAQGVPLGGAADPFALRLANLLVGNPEDAAALELTLVGPELLFSHDAVVACGGAVFEGLPTGRPVAIRAGTVLKLGHASCGGRGYLAIAGGLEVAPVLGSRSTYLRAALGGWGGRALREGDVLPVPIGSRSVSEHWRIDERMLPGYASDVTLRVVAGEQAAEFSDGWTDREFRVSPQSDRMGLRLHGAALARTTARELISAPVTPGTVQVPPDGQPIVLLADAQTIGGYPQLAHVIAVDLPLVAQLRPGGRVRFRAVTLSEARELTLARERAVGLLREGLAQKFR